MAFQLKNHPRWKPSGNMKNQSKILQGTEENERIRINSSIIVPNDFKKVEDVLISQPEELKNETIHSMWERACKNFPDNNCLGDRLHGGSEFQWKSYSDCGKIVDKVAAAIVHTLDQQQSNDVTIGMFSGNCWEWTLTGNACMKNKQIMVPLYDTLGDQAMRYITKLCEFEVMFIDTEARFTFFMNEVFNHSEGYKVKHVVCFNKLSVEAKTLADDSLKVHDFTELFESVTEPNEPTESTDLSPPTQKDVAVINFTSGTTGNPKGVLLTHGNYMSNIAASLAVIPNGVSEKDVWLSYLPAAHGFERLLQFALLSVGGSIGFFGGNPKNLIADAAALKPTVFGAVPRVWSKIYDKLQAAQNESFIKGMLIGWALRNKVAMVENGVDRNDTIYDWLVFGKIQALLGGRLRCAISGAAPIKNDVLNSIRAALGCTIQEAYGQTETSGATTATLAHDSGSSVGPPIFCNAVKLESVLEMDYHSKNDVGEICVKGFNVMAGYYRNEEKTKETIDEDGWLHTGDIGKWNPDGTLSIIDRKKHIFKLAQGEYIAPEKIENVYVTHPAVAQSFVFGESLRSTLVGLIFPDVDGGFVDWAKRSGFKDQAFEELVKNEEVSAKLLEELRLKGSENKLRGFEQVRAIRIMPKLMTLEDGLLTPTMKSKRPQIAKHFRSVLEELYTKVSD